jgi:hypothetical protein
LPVTTTVNRQRVAGSRSITINVNDPGITGPLPLPGAPAGTRPKLRGNDKHAVIRGVEPHIARRLWRLHVFDDVILIRRVLMNHSQRAVRIRGKRVA